jgi:hypothetical protein
MLCFGAEAILIYVFGRPPLTTWTQRSQLHMSQNSLDASKQSRYMDAAVTYAKFDKL